MLGDDGIAAVLHVVHLVAGAVAFVQHQQGAADTLRALVANTSAPLPLLLLASAEAGHPLVSEDLLQGVSGVRIGVEHPGDKVSDSCKVKERKCVNQLNL